MAEPVSRLELEQLALGELDPAVADALRARIAADPALARRFERLSAELSADAPLPPLHLPAEDPPVAPIWPRWASVGGVGLLLVAAVALFALFAVAPDSRSDPATPADVAFRGAFELEVLRIRNGEAVPQEGLIRAREGDRLQFSVRPGDRADHVAVFDVQDDGAVAVWSPSVQVGPDGVVPVSVVLDGYPGLERVYVLVSAEPVDPARFEAALRRTTGTPLAELDALPGLEGVTQRSLMILEDP